MGHHQEGSGRGLVKPLERVSYFFPEPGIKCGKGLIKKEYPGLDYQGTCQGNSLFLNLGFYI